MAQPEAKARENIDRQLELAGWVVQDDYDPRAGRGIALREAQFNTGAVDYLLVVDRQAIGTVEAKKEGTPLIGVEEQSAKYRVGLSQTIRLERNPLPFSYEATGIETRFTSYLDPEPRSRNVFSFHRPETLADWLTLAPADKMPEGNETLRARLLQMPLLETKGLRDCQIEAINNLETSFAENRPRALLQMATGSGKTFTAVSSIYRLIKYGGAKRILFLVDRSNLARQTLKEFEQYVTPDDGRKFTELYNVQHLKTNSIDNVSRVCITTIQRLYSMLSGETEYDPELEELSLSEITPSLSYDQKKEVQYNPNIPIEQFDIIITDECHRSIYNLWRGVLEYFDAFIVGLTATPNKQTFGFFSQNLVMEYGHDRAVTDGVNVDYQVYRIRTEITESGGRIESGFYIDKRDRQTRKKRWEMQDEEMVYSSSQLDRDVVAPDQIRTVIREFQASLPVLFPGRTEVPKTLVFAKDDSHADDIVQIIRDVFGKGNEFAQKITYRTTGRKPEDLVNEFRNSYYPRVAVTVDMISTGTDIKPLEVLLFMRSVKSQGLFEQMKGRGTRVIDDNDLRSVTPDAATKTHFVLIDAVGVCERLKTDEPPLEKKRGVSFEKLINSVPGGFRDEDTLSSLAGRLGRLARRVSAQDNARVQELTGGKTIHDLAAELIRAVDPDIRLETAQAMFRQEEPGDKELAQAAVKLTDEAAAPFDDPALRNLLITIQQKDEQIIDTISQDTVTFSGWDAQAEDWAKNTITSFRQYIEDHKDEITALQILYSRPRHAGLKLSDIRDLATAIQSPPLSLTTDKLWQAYAQLDRSHVHEAGKQRMLADLVALIRYTLERDTNTSVVLEPYAETVQRRYEQWLAEQEQRRGQSFTDEQRQWLDYMARFIADSLELHNDDFDLEPFSQKGGLGKAYQLFGSDLPDIIQELNERLPA